MHIQLTINAVEQADLAQLAKIFASLTSETAFIVRPPETTPAGNARMAEAQSANPRVTAPPMQRVESIPAPPLDADTKAKLEALEARPKAPVPAEEPEVKRGRGRPPGSKNKPKEWQPPVPRPEGGVYGKQTVDPEGSPAAQLRAVIRKRMHVVVAALQLAGVDHAKFIDMLLKKFGDGAFNTVPPGNLEALVLEAEAGPENHPISQKAIEEATEEYDRQKAAKAAAEAGAT